MKIEKAILKTLTDLCGAYIRGALGIEALFKIKYEGKNITIQSLPFMPTESFAEVSEEGKPFEIFVNGIQFMQTISLFRRFVEIEIEKGIVVLSEDKFVRRLKTVPTELKDWQFLKEPKTLFTVHETAKKALFESLDSVLDHSQGGTFRDCCEFSGVAGEGLRIFASEGHMAHVRKYALAPSVNFKLNIPLPVLSIFQKNGGDFEFSMVADDSGNPFRAFFKFAHVKYLAPLYSLTYPDVEKGVIKVASKPAFKIPADILTQALIRFKSYSSVKLQWGDLALKISAKADASESSDEIELSESFEANKATYSPDYLLRLLANAPEDAELSANFSTGHDVMIFSYGSTQAAVAGIMEK